MRKIDQIKPHCYMCKNFFNSDSVRVQIKVLFSNDSQGKIPLCDKCEFDKAAAEKEMRALWKLEMELSGVPKGLKDKMIASNSKLKIVKRVY